MVQQAIQCYVMRESILISTCSSPVILTTMCLINDNY